MVECMTGGSLQCACLHLENQKTERTGYEVLRWSHLSGLYSPAKPFVPKCPTSSQNSAISWRPRVQTRDHMARVGVGSLLHIQSIAVVFPETEIVRASGFGLSKKQENCSRVPYPHVSLWGGQCLMVPSSPLDLLSIFVRWFSWSLLHTDNFSFEEKI